MTAFIRKGDYDDRITHRSPLNKPFVRTRVTWLSYILFAYFGLGVSLLGPLMPFIAEKLELTFTEVGYHLMLLGSGGLIIGLIGSQVVTRFGTNRITWSATILIAVGLIGVIFGSSLPVTLACTVLYSVGLASVFQNAVAAVAHAHPHDSAKAFSEANIFAGITPIAGPLLIGLLAASAFRWQATALLAPLFLILIAITFRGVSLSMTATQHKSARPDDNRRLPLLFWMFGVLFLLSASVELLISAWGANFLVNAVGYAPSTAAALVSVFAVAIVLGRMVGRRLLNAMSEFRLLMLSLLWTLLAFPLFWLSPLPLLNVVGLFLVGLGVGNLSPLVQSAALSAAGPATNRASARLAFFPALGVVITLQLMGILADGIGIQRAYSIEIVLLLAFIIIAWNANRIRRAIPPFSLTPSPADPL